MMRTSFYPLRSSFLFVMDLLGGGLRVEYKESSEEVLAKQMSSGDDRAFEELYVRYFDQLFGFIKRRVDSPEIAEDLVSSIFLKVFAARKRFVGTTFKAWLYRIASNTLIDHYRTHKPTTEFDSQQHDVATSGSSTPETLDQRSLRQMLEKVLSHLDTRSQLVIQLKFFSQLSNEEIALTLHVSTNHVGVLTYRALQKCAKFFPKNMHL